MPTPVEEIKERLNIVDVVQEYVPLKKAGANHKACCPFHNEKTPSFTVSESKQFFHCFGCGKGGDLFTFVQEIEGVEFAEALRMLAKKAGVELRPTNPREHNERTRLLDCLHLAADYFRVALKQSKEGEVARDYLKKRDVSDEIQERFQIGYSADSWDALMTFLKKKGYKEKEIEQAGLIAPSEKTGGHYDRFRGRLMFPIHNAHGNVIGFGGRTLDPDQKEAKYINSPQTRVYNKSEVLYGLHLAKKYIQKMDATVIVEGYMDVITAHQAKFRNVVSASGTALTEEQIRRLQRFSNNVILAFDADTAGLSAAWRGMQIAIQQGMNIKIMMLPPGKDPDDIIREDPTTFRQLAIEAKPFMEYAFETVLSPLDLTDVLNKKKAAKELLPMIAMFPDKIEQTHYIKKLAEKVEVSPDVLQETIDNTRKKQQQRPRQQEQQPASTQEQQRQQPPQRVKRTREEALTEQLLALIALEPQEFPVVKDKMKEGLLHGDQHLALYKFLETSYNPSGNLQGDGLHFQNEQLQAKWRELEIIGEELYHGHPLKQRQKELLSLLESLERIRIKSRLKQVEHGLATAEHNNDTAIIRELSDEFRQLTETLKKLG